jgi:hypothetical protein
MADDFELEAKRNCAAYADTRNRLRHTRTDLSEEQIDAIALAAVETAVFGFDAKKNSKGEFIQQGIGSPGHETANHFASIRRWEGKEAWEAAVRKLWKENPAHAAKLGLPQPRAT